MTLWEYKWVWTWKHGLHAACNTFVGGEEGEEFRENPSAAIQPEIMLCFQRASANLDKPAMKNGKSIKSLGQNNHQKNGIRSNNAPRDVWILHRTCFIVNSFIQNHIVIAILIINIAHHKFSSYHTALIQLSSVVRRAISVKCCHQNNCCWSNTAYEEVIHLRAPFN